MSTNKVRGRRSAAVPPARAAPALSRREARRREARPHERSRMAQKAGMALALAGLALAVTVPTTAATLTAIDPEIGLAHIPAVTAAVGAELQFTRSGVSSGLDADGKLHQTLEVSADKVTPAAARGTLSAPLDTLTPTSPFGYRVNPLTGERGELHTGQDYAAACGTAVHATAGGTVAFAGWHPYGGGNRIVVDHGSGLSTTYNHLSAIGVKVGQKLDRGQTIAQSGTTGSSTGCHLHFEVMVDSKTVDPIGWL